MIQSQDNAAVSLEGWPHERRCDLPTERGIKCERLDGAAHTDRERGRSDRSNQGRADAPLCGRRTEELRASAVLDRFRWRDRQAAVGDLDVRCPLLMYSKVAAVEVLLPDRHWVG